MHRHVTIVALTTALLYLGTPAAADAQRATPSASQTRLLLAPLSTLGSEPKSKTKKIQRQIESGLRAVGNFSLVSQRELRRALRKSRKARLRNCDGAVPCLSALGKLVNAEFVVYAEIGGLGSVQVIYMKLVDVGRQREVRSTTLELGRTGQEQLRARAAATRLLAPRRFVGRLAVNVDVKGATVYVDGTRMATSPTKPIALSVGTHALRITHPEFRDFVRFVTIEFEKEATIEADMQQFPIVSSGMAPRNGSSRLPTPNKNGVIYRGVQPTPWHRRWYTIAGAAALLLLTSALTIGALSGGIDADREKTVRPPM